MQETVSVTTIKCDICHEQCSAEYAPYVFIHQYPQYFKVLDKDICTKCALERFRDIVDMVDTDKLEYVLTKPFHDTRSIMLC